MNPYPALAALAGYGLDGGFELPARPLDPPAWTTLMGQVTSAKLTGVLARAIAEGAMPATDAQTQAVTDLHVEAMTRVLRIERRLLVLSRRFGDEGLGVRVLKGSAHAHLLATDPSDRAFVDLDLLVHENDYERAAEIIDEAGFHRDAPERRPGFDRRYGKGATFLAADGESVDLHRTLVAGPLGLRIHTQDPFEVSDAFVVGGRRLNGLDPLHRLVHCGYLASVADRSISPYACRELVLALGAARHDPDAVLAVAARWGAAAALADAIRRSIDLLGIRAPVPLLEWARDYEPSARERWELGVYQSRRRSNALLLFATTAAVPGTRGKLEYVRGMALPDRGEGRDGPLVRWPRAVKLLARRG